MGLNKSHFISLLSYVGIGLLASGIAYGFYHTKAGIIFSIIGFLLFVLAQISKKSELMSWFQLLLFAKIFAVCIGMIIGGILYFGSHPDLALWLIPTGFLISWLVFGIRYKWKNFNWVSALGGILSTALISALVYGAILYLPNTRYINSDHINSQENSSSISTGSRLEQFQNIIFGPSIGTGQGSGTALSGEILTGTINWMKNKTESEIMQDCMTMPSMEGCDMLILPAVTGAITGNMIDHDTGMSHNHADMVNSEVDFIALMIPHHQEAVDSTIRLLNSTQNPTLQYLGNNIVSSQEAEIKMMQGWLSTQFTGRSYTGMPYMPMMRDTSTLSSTTTIEKMWIEDMIAHHQGAVDMAKKVLTLSPRQEIKTFAENIIKVQSNEIQLMSQLLSNY